MCARFSWSRGLLPGFTLEQCRAVNKTYDGEPNLDGFLKERLIDKVLTLARLCAKLTEYAYMVNEELYSMHIPHHVLLGWDGLQAVRMICVKFAVRCTPLRPTDPQLDLADTDSLACVRQTKKGSRLHRLLLHL